MPINDELGRRMKEYYENRSKTALTRRMPVAIRIDGKAFHTFTRGFEKPFDKLLMTAMQETTRFLCENIQGCVLGYTQSDEITLILCDYQTLTTDAWFDYEVQKICSVAASMATFYFNKVFSGFVKERISRIGASYVYGLGLNASDPNPNYTNALMRAVDKGAMFDARCFNIPREEVTNLIYWRQLDAIRNSIQMVGQANFSHKELQGKSCKMIQEMLWQEKSINWDSYPADCKRGSCVIKTEAGWIIDRLIPIFKGSGRDYIEKCIYFEEEA